MFGEVDAAGQGGMSRGAPAQAPFGRETRALSFGGSPDTTFDLAEYWRLAVKHRFLIIGALLATLVVGAVMTMLMTPIYRASTTLQIDRESARVLNVDEVQPQESLIQGEEFFQTQYGLLRSRSLAERVVDSLGLATSDAFLQKMKVDLPETESTAGQRAAHRREIVLRIVEGNLSIAPVRGSRLVVVSFASPDPQLAAQIANAYGQNFIQANLDRRYESSAYARTFLEDLIAQTKGKLEAAERELVAYAGNQQIINVREADASAGTEAQSLVSVNLAILNSSLATARGQRVAAEAKWRQASDAALLNLPEVLQNPAIQRLLEERARVEAEYQQKLQIYQPAWPEMVQLKARQDELTGQINTLASGIRNSIRGQYTVALNEENALRAQVERLKGDVLDLRDRSIQYNILQRELDTSRTLYDGLLQRYKEVGVTGGITSNNISIVDQAQVPDRPSEPRLLLNMVLAALLGLGLGLAAAFILEALDETLASPEDVESKLNLPTLGVIPLLERGQAPLTALADTRSDFSEAYYSLRTAVQFSTPDGAPATLLVTSSRPAEGKSTTAFATAANLARLGRRVLLIDGDLRNPSMHRVIGVENESGMSNLLSGAADIRSLVKPTSEPNLDFIPCGPLPPNPAELWGGDRFKSVLAEAGALYDHIVIDGPPVLGFADAPLLSSAVRGTLFVLESKGTRRAQARGALRRLSVGGGHILGAVLTKFNTKAVQYGGYDYAYDYSYGASAADSRKREAKRR